MAHPLSTIGIIHTTVSIVPVIAGVYSFATHGKIVPKLTSGKIYFLGLILSVLSAFGVSSTGGINAGHLFGLFVLAIALMGIVVEQVKLLGNMRQYLSTFGISFSFFLSLIPGTNETLTRLPPHAPIASGIDSPVVLYSILFLLCLFICGFIWQCKCIYQLHRQ